MRVGVDFSRFSALAKQGNIIPVYLEDKFDLLTPVSAYLKLALGKEYSFLFESVAGGEKLGRYSFIGVDPFKTIYTGENHPLKGDPLVIVEQEFKDIKYVTLPELPSFTGGAVGYISYDCVQFFEPKTARELKDTLGLPESALMFCSTVVIFDHLHHIMKVVTNVRLPKDTPSAEHLQVLYGSAITDLNKLMQTLEQPDTPMPPQGKIRLGLEGKSNVGREGYQGFVHSLKKNIFKGDIIQAVPSQRIARPTDLHPFNLYRELRSINPSPYMFYIQMNDFQIVGASPEMLVKVEKGHVTTHPIAGTRRRGATPAEDEATAAELLADEKETSEHIMLVDLGRNDVNRICKPETVQVESLMHIERYSHVMHIVSNVTGLLRDHLTPFDAFRSIFPAGTVSGAPKIRAIELVGELEKEKRGVYAGAVGYFSFSGDVDTCIAIRTMVVKNGVAYLQAGGGIVYDSDPESEYQETINKLNSNLAAIRKAEERYAAAVGVREEDAEPPRKKIKVALGNGGTSWEGITLEVRSLLFR
eukprot:Colp12_sorted_trinity150504_noHs@10715